ncbi:MAG: sce7725 family protein [Methylococcaceae bacterium]
MYYPYFRGKQNELITIRENAQLLKKSRFVPIIEPVKESLGGLTKTLSAVVDADGEVIVIVNPYHGDHSTNGDSIFSLLQNEFEGNQNISAGILLSEDVTITNVKDLYASLKTRPITLIHAGFTDAKLLAESLGNALSNTRHVFFEDNCGKLYRKHFKSPRRVLLRDGFQKRTNREHPPVEFFSDLHVTYEEEGMDGFGDFLIVGDEYSETGGPAYAVAIHLTFIDPDKDDEMHIHHFKSIRQDDPKDPAGKFLEALDKLVDELNRPTTRIFLTSAVEEFLDLHKRGHFPGLGYVKKLSMKHHIETLANFFKNK